MEDYVYREEVKTIIDLYQQHHDLWHQCYGMECRPLSDLECLYRVIGMLYAKIEDEMELLNGTDNNL